MFSYVANAGDISAADAERWHLSLADILVRYPRGVDIAALLPAGTPPADDAPATGTTPSTAPTTAPPVVPAADVPPGDPA
jgi:hypothetical protein